MKKLRIVEQNFLTLEEGCNKYLDNCRSRNLREGTINHYRQSCVQFAKFFDIPVRTLQDWEQERRVPPPYVPGMMLRILKHEFVGKSKKRTDKGADNSANQGEKVRKGAGE